MFEEYPPERWRKQPPRNIQEVLAAAAGLVFNDRQTTGKLAPATREALRTMWRYQRDGGGWTWRNDGYPLTEIDEHYGVTLAALTVGIAPDGYINTGQIAPPQRRRVSPKKAPPGAG